MNPAEPATPNETPLQGWKEIAAHLGRDVSTARRWEREASLPVRRHRSDRRSSVFAYPSEIEAWRRQGGGQEMGPHAAPPVWRRPATWAAVAAVVVAALGIAYGPILNPDHPVAEAADDSMRAEQVWTDAAADSSARLSPDGTLLSYTDWSTGELWVRDVATGESRAVTNDGGWDQTRSFVETSAISPDGKHIAAAWYNDEIQNYEGRIGSMPESGAFDNGEAVFQTSEGQAGYVAAIGWTSDTEAVFWHTFGFASSISRLTLADTEDGEARVLKTFDWGGDPAEAVVSPDGRWIAYGFRETPETRDHDVRILASDGSAEHIVVDHPADDLPVAWTSDGSHLLFRSLRSAGQSIWAIPIAEGKAQGGAKMVSPDVSAFRALGLSAAGELYYTKRVGSQDVYEARVDLASGALVQEPRRVDVGFVSSNIDPIYSPDGRRLAYLSDRSLHPFGGYGSRRVVIRDLGTGEETDLDPGGLAVAEVGWSPDSESVLLAALDSKGVFGAYRFTLTAAAPERLLQLPPREQGRPKNFGWMADGKSIFLLESALEPVRHQIHYLETGAVRDFLTAPPTSRLVLSPDGSRFARKRSMATGDGDPAWALSVADAKTAEEREVVRFECCPPTSMSWTPDGESIVFWRKEPGQAAGARPRTFRLWIATVDTSQVRQTDLQVSDLARPNLTVSLHPDGERITYSAGWRDFEIWKLSNFLDRIGASD